MLIKHNCISTQDCPLSWALKNLTFEQKDVDSFEDNESTSATHCPWKIINCLTQHKSGHPKSKNIVKLKGEFIQCFVAVFLIKP